MTPPERAAEEGRYPIPQRTHRVEESVQRSRFITTLAHAPDADAAHAFVQDVREEFPDATHHCWAFVAGPPGSTAHIGMSDDGEPHGTAGKPMLTTLLHSGVGEIVAVCARYYGGVKLGTGGLSRAYSGGVKVALAELSVVERVQRAPFTVVVAYADVDAVSRVMQEMDVRVDDAAYGADVRYACAVPESAVRAFERAVADVTRGEGRVIA